MAFSKNLRQTFGLGADRIVERGQGCWNCTSFDNEKAKELWWNKARAASVEKGVKLALEAPLGEEDPRVLALRKMVPEVDVGMEQVVWGICAKGKMEADFVHSTGLCADGWSGKQGASLATQGKTDILPMEALERQEKAETHGDD